jgi:hypothetical protein
MPAGEFSFRQMENRDINIILVQHPMFLTKAIFHSADANVITSALFSCYIIHNKHHCGLL